MESPISVKVDLGIAETVRTVDKILLRRRNRKSEALADFVANLSDGLEASSEIIKTLDNIFIELVRGFASKTITGDQTLLDAHVEETRKYLTSRDLLPRLEDCIGVISAASVDSRMKDRTFRDIVSTLRSLTARLQLYRDQLGRGGVTGVGQTQEWNLETLCERSLKYEYGGGKIDITIADMAEEVLRNQDFDVSDNIHRLIGKARTQAKTLIM